VPRAMRADADALLGPARFGDGLHAIVHEIEDNLLKLDAVAEDRGQRIADLELERDPVGRGVRPGEHQRIRSGSTISDSAMSGISA
jgi:hypothetical protein